MPGCLGRMPGKSSYGRSFSRKKQLTVPQRKPVFFRFLGGGGGSPIGLSWPPPPLTFSSRWSCFLVRICFLPCFTISGNQFITTATLCSGASHMEQGCLHRVSRGQPRPPPLSPSRDHSRRNPNPRRPAWSCCLHPAIHKSCSRLAAARS